MKQHKRIVIVISLALALILLVGALPALAQNNTSISNFQYDGIDGSTHQYKFSWDTIANSSIYRFQVKGACVSAVWVSMSYNSTWSSGGKSQLRAGQLRDYGCTLKFRLKLKVPGGYTSWAYAS